MKKKLLLDPSLHIIENEDSLLLTTRSKHVKIPVDQSVIKEKIYQLFEYIDQGMDYDEIMEQKKYNKLIEQLIGHGIVFVDQITSNFKRKIKKIGVSSIMGDRKVISFLNKMLDPYSMDLHSHCLRLIHDQEKEEYPKELFYWINHNYLYITLDHSFKEKIRDHSLNDLSAQYIAHMIMEFLQRDEPIDPNYIYRYELSKPTAPPKALFKTVDLDHLHCYREYLLFDEREGEFTVREESKEFFPYHSLYAVNKETKKKFYGIGRNEEEAFRNLLCVIQVNKGDRSINIAGHGENDEMSETELLFFVKITNLYTRKEVEIIDYASDFIHFELAGLSLKINGCKLHYSLALFLLSMYKTLFEMGEEDVMKTIILDLQQSNQVREGDPVG